MNQTCRESCLGTQCVFLFIYIKFYKYKNNNKFLYNFHNDLKLRKGPCLYFEIGCSRVLRFCEKGLSDDNSNNNRNEMKAQRNDAFFLYENDTCICNQFYMPVRIK